MTISRRAGFLKPYVRNTTYLLNRFHEERKSFLFEGAQGALLDISLGTYPFVTSSHPTVGGVLIGTGLSHKAIGKVIGISKAYATRVGEGPFPTELKDADRRPAAGKGGRVRFHHRPAAARGLARHGGAQVRADGQRRRLDLSHQARRARRSRRDPRSRGLRTGRRANRNFRESSQPSAEGPAGLPNISRAGKNRPPAANGRRTFPRKPGIICASSRNRPAFRSNTSPSAPVATRRFTGAPERFSATGS